jgi:hypothetical protein
MIQIKDIDVFKRLMSVPCDTILLDIIEWVYHEFPGQVFITSGYRPGDPGVHGTIPCRGMDLRSRAFHGDPESIEEYINYKWSYDFERPTKMVCLYHSVDPKGYGLHFHLQSHPNTRQRNVVA